MSLQSRIEAAGVPYLTRSEWGASVDRWRWNSGARRDPIPMSLPVDEFYVHHSVTQPTTDPARDMRVVEDIGLNRFGRFSYSYAIHPPTGTIMEGAGDWIGAHTFGRNSSALAAVAIGNFDESRPPKALINSYGVLIRALKAEGKLRDPLTIRGHRDVRSTGCPGGHLYAAIPDIRHLAALSPSQPPEEEDEDPMRVAWFTDPEKGTHAYLITGREAVHLKNRDELNHQLWWGAKWIGPADKGDAQVVAPFWRPLRVVDGPFKNI